MSSNFVPIILPEDKSPSEADEYKKCEVCTDRSPVIWGEGNPRASIIIILDNPGARVDKEGKEYICGTRETLQSGIYKARLDIKDIYVTYLLKCRPLASYDKEKVRAFSKPFLIKQIKSIYPKYLVCLGDVVVQSMFNDKGAHVKNLRGLWHNIEGFDTMVSYHPLAIRRRPNLMKIFLEDWEMLSDKINKKNTDVYY